MPKQSPSSSLALLAVASVVLVASGCQPSLPSPSPSNGATASSTAEPHARLEPESSLDEAPRVLRVHVVPVPGNAVDLTRLLFVRGHVGPAHVREIENQDLSAALTERILPALTFARDDEGVIAPLVTLDPGTTYGVLSGDPPLGVDIHVAKEDAAPLLDRAWPPLGSEGAGPFAIFCGDAALALVPARVDLDPAAIPGALVAGAAARIGSKCVRLDTLTPALPLDDDVSAALPPLVVPSPEGAPIRLDPAAIPLLGAPPAPFVLPLACAADEIPFGPGCARIEDDRARIATPDAPLLWAVRTEGGAETIRATAPSEPWTLLDLPPDHLVDLEVAAVDVLGRVRTSSIAVHTTSPRAHVVLSEVLANPLGAEPDQEWVELYNDGLAPADLSGFQLTDIGGVTELPVAVLDPGAFLLVVNDSFLPDDELDPPPAKGTLLLHVPKLGKGGLKNDGEPLKLLDAKGLLISRLPATPKTKPGQSLARVHPSAPDGDPASFEARTPTPGAPN